jgi:hypothetical protein
MVSRGISSGKHGKGGGGFRGQATNVLWCVRLPVAGNSLCSILHQESIRRHDQKAQSRTSIKEWESLPVEPSVDKGPADVEEIGEHSDRWTPNSTASNQRNHAHRLSRRGIWWKRWTLRGTQGTLDSGRTKEYGNRRIERSAFRSGNSMQFVLCSWEHWKNALRRREYLY